MGKMHLNGMSYFSSNVEEIIQKIEMIGDNKSGLYMLDNELSARAAAPASE